MKIKTFKYDIYIILLLLKTCHSTSTYKFSIKTCIFVENSINCGKIISNNPVNTDNYIL